MDEKTHVEQLVGPGPALEQGSSLLDQLAKQRKTIAELRETFITIPGYEKSGIELLAKYQLVEGKELEKIARQLDRRQRSNWQRNLSAACQVMAKACTGIYYRTPEMDEPAPLRFPHPDGDEIWGFGDPSLAQALQITNVQTAKDMIIAVFCDNETAVSAHSAKLQRWFQDTSAEVDSDFLGEGL